MATAAAEVGQIALVRDLHWAVSAVQRVTRRTHGAASTWAVVSGASTPTTAPTQKREWARGARW